MSVRKKLAAAGIIAAGVALAGAAAAAPPARAAAPLFTAVTHISNNPDSGGNGNWAYDNITRVLDVYANPGGCASLAAFAAPADTCYSGTISDTGSFATIPGAYQPNQGDPANQTGARISASVSGTMTGTASYVFYAPAGDAPSAANVPQNVNDSYATPSITTPQWYEQAFTAAFQPAVKGLIDNTWSWSYATGCESWTDSAVNGDGQSANLSADGNITGTVCAAPVPSPSGTVTAPPPPAVVYGNEVNPFGNGLDVFRQRDAVDTVIAGWPVTQRDPATHFLREQEGANVRFEYAPDGGGTGLCVSNPAGGYPGDPGGPFGLVLRGCNGSRFQQFAETGGHLVSVINGQVVSPDGTGAQLVTTGAPVSWGGSRYSWRDFSHFPA